MKKYSSNQGIRATRFAFIFFSVLWALIVVRNAFATIPTTVVANNPGRARQDTVLFSRTLSQVRKKLNYPNQTMRFYKLVNYERAWVKSDTVHSDVFQGMMLLDCVLQFGLNRNDFHPDKLPYDSLSALTIPRIKTAESAKITFDIYMTDALITLINHLHYGKFNPRITTAVLEGKSQLKLDAAAHLFQALGQRNFMDAIVSAQPKTRNYQLLQDYLHLVKGQYIDDCYEFPEGDARKMAINMERMRWMNTESEYYIQVNIPSYTLSAVRHDSIKLFKVIVGKPSTPSPELESQITMMTTAPEWKVPHKIFISELLPKALKDSAFLNNNHYSLYDKSGRLIEVNIQRLMEVKANPGMYSLRQSSGCDNAMGKIVFRFPNLFDIYLHDSPEQKLFNQTDRPFSHGCLRVSEAEKLAAWLLVNDRQIAKIAQLKDAIENLLKRDFKLNHPVPIKITYLTCEINNGLFTKYPDVYHRDQSLELLMFPGSLNIAKMKK